MPRSLEVQYEGEVAVPGKGSYLHLVGAQHTLMPSGEAGPLGGPCSDCVHARVDTLGELLEALSKNIGKGKEKKNSFLFIYF